MADLPRKLVMRYRRSMTPGATYFFTVVTYRRRPILCEPDAVALLREAFAAVKQRRPFHIDAVVILPNHLHCLWTLPTGDADYSTRWMLIKSYFTRRCPPALKTARSAALRHKREQTLWQHRYWEHQIRDDRDFERHCDYIHYNPIKHGLVMRVADWPYSSFHRFVRDGVYPLDWGGLTEPGRSGNVVYCPTSLGQTDTLGPFGVIECTRSLFRQHPL